MDEAKPKLSSLAAPAAPGETASDADFLAAIGREVRRQRAKRGMTRRQLAQGSGASERYLAQIESGGGNPSASVLRAIAQALDLPASALLPETARASGRARRHSRFTRRKCRKANCRSLPN